MENKVPEKAKLLEKLRKNGFNVPDFIYVPAEKFSKEKFKDLESFLAVHRESYKVIARSAHPLLRKEKYQSHKDCYAALLTRFSEAQETRPDNGWQSDITHLNPGWKIPGQQNAGVAKQKTRALLHMPLYWI